MPYCLDPGKLYHDHVTPFIAVQYFVWQLGLKESAECWMFSPSNCLLPKTLWKPLGCPYHKTHVVGNPTNQHSLGRSKWWKNSMRGAGSISLYHVDVLSESSSTHLDRSRRPYLDFPAKMESAEIGWRKNILLVKRDLSIWVSFLLTTKTGCKPPLCSQKSH